MITLGDGCTSAGYLIGLLHNPVLYGQSEQIISRICIDSREAGEGSLFIPLKGERVDGHNYIEDAWAAGARAFFIDRSRQEQIHHLRGNYPDMLLILVEDTLSALQEMAKQHVTRFPDIVKIGITGSNGKTTTKECIASILSTIGKVSYTQGNLNSEIGLPLSLMSISAETEFAVFEMGINRRGEMDILVDIFRPQYAVITNIGTAHIGPLGSRDKIAEEKRKILRYVREAERAVLWEDDDYLEYLSSPFSGDCSLFGEKHMKDLAVGKSEGLKGTVLSYRDVEIRLSLPGRHNLMNALSAIRLSQLFDVSPGLMKEGLEAVSPLFGRGQVWKGRVTILSDCYNANLESMKSSIDFFSSLESDGLRHYVLGSMKELGEESESAHRDLGAFLKGLVAHDPVYLFGQEMEAAYKELRKTSNVIWTKDFEVLKKRLLASIGIGDQVLLKGSRSTNLERLIDLFELELSENRVC